MKEVLTNCSAVAGNRQCGMVARTKTMTQLYYFILYIKFALGQWDDITNFTICSICP